jgi:hypothetical protein
VREAIAEELDEGIPPEFRFRLPTGAPCSLKQEKRFRAAVRDPFPRSDRQPAGRGLLGCPRSGTSVSLGRGLTEALVVRSQDFLPTVVFVPPPTLLTVASAVAINPQPVAMQVATAADVDKPALAPATPLQCTFLPWLCVCLDSPSTDCACLICLQLCHPPPPSRRRLRRQQRPWNVRGGT